MDTYLITGATGYIGSLLSEYLLQQGQQVTVIVRNIEKLKVTLKDKVNIIQGDIRDSSMMDRILGRYDYLIHCAAPTQSAYMISNPIEVANTIIQGTQNMLKLASRCQIKSMVFLSSMEVYGKMECLKGEKISEEKLGDLDITNVRSCYPMAKRMAENYCYSYYKEYGVPVKVARLAQTFGRDISENDNRVFAQFANAVRNHTDIVLHTKGNSVGNYCDIDDAISGILFLLTCGSPGEAYNIVNEANTMTIREMAELVVDKIAEGDIRVRFDIPKDNCFGYAEETGVRLSGEKMKVLGWEARTGLEEMYRNILKD